MYWSKILIGYACSWVSFCFFYALKLIIDLRPFNKRINPIPKQYYLIHSQYFKGICKFVREDKSNTNKHNFGFKNNSFQSEFDKTNIRYFYQKDIIREANNEELKEALIDEL